MKRYLLLYMVIITFIFVSLGNAQTNPVVSKDEATVFDGMISFVLGVDGKTVEFTSDCFVFAPSSGGVFTIEYLKPGVLENKVDADNSYAELQAWVREMKSNYPVCHVPLQSTIQTNIGYAFHTQDYSFDPENSFEIVSDGYLLYTSKGPVALWFSSFFNSLIQDSFVSSVLHTLSVDNVSVFSSDMVNQLVSMDKLHYIFWECEEISYKQVARNPYDYVGKKAVFIGSVIQVIEKGLDTTLRVKLNKEYQRTDDIIYVEYRRSNIRDSRILDDDYIAIYGVLDGLETYETVLRAQASNPRIVAKYITLLDDVP